MNPINKSIITDLEVEYSNYKLRKDSIADDHIKTNKCLVVRVSADLNFYGRINYCSKNVEEVLFFKTNEVLMSKISKLMVGNLASNHDVFMLAFMTNSIYKPLEHAKTNYLLKRDGFVIEVEITIRTSFNYHSEGLEFF